MTDTHYLSQARLRRDASVSALLPLLLGDRDHRSSGQPGHHLVWYLFAERNEAHRDFLWREMAPGSYLVLSARQPVDRCGLFELDEPKAFEPLLEQGDRLRFSLRANAVVRRRAATGGRIAKHDVVFDALRDRASGERAANRFATARQQGFAWLERQGQAAGFGVREQDVLVDRYQQHKVPRKAEAPMSYSTLDFDGVLTVDDPSRFLAAIARGFGSAKAYGCGLMLIRRA